MLCSVPVSLIFYIILPLLLAECTILRLISQIRLSLYSLTANNGPVESVQDKARQTHDRKKWRIWDIFITSRSDGMPEETAHWQRVCLGSLLTWLPLCGLQTGPGSMCSYSWHSWDPNTKTPQAWSPTWQEGKSESCECAASALLKHLWCSKTLLSSGNTPTTFTDDVQKHFTHQKHDSTICLELDIPLLCFASAVKEEKKNFSIMVYIQKHSLGSFLGDMKGNLGRHIFFHEVSLQGILGRMSAPREHRLIDLVYNWYWYAVESSAQLDRQGIPFCAKGNVHRCH